MYNDRKGFYRAIETERGSRVLAYITGDRPGMETQIHPEVLDFLADHLDGFGLPDRISLVLYSRGGSTLAGWSIANLIRQFCKNFEVIIPGKALSSATLLSLAADRILMTKQATLGPIDPSVNSPLNPAVPGAPPTSRLPVSVEEVVGYFELAKQQAGLKGATAMTEAFSTLGANVHPIVLGRVYRARTQIQMLARRLLSKHMTNEGDIARIVSFICSESGSHDYTIFRREAKEELKLPVEKPSQLFYDTVIKPLYRDLRDDLKLGERFDPILHLGNTASSPYSFKRSLVESLSGGQHAFVSEGTLIKKTQTIPNGSVNTTGFEDTRTYEGWKHYGP